MKINALFIFFVFSWAGLAVEYTLKIPVPATAKVEEANEIITIDATFKPTSVFNAQLNRKVDRKHAERICNEALRRYFEVGQGGITYSGLQSVGAPAYLDESVSFAFSVPKKAVKVIPKTPEDNRNASSQQPSALDVASSTQSKPNINGASLKTLSSNTSPSTSPTSGAGVSRGSIKWRFITDGELGKLPMAGYSIRLRQDFQSMFEMKWEDLHQCQNDANWEALVSISALRKEVTSVFDLNAIRAKYKFDAHLTGHDLDELLQYIGEQKTRIEAEIMAFHIQLYNDIQDELRQLRKQLAEEWETALPANKASLKDELKSVEEQLKEMDILKP